jgi:hypothetical protein
MLQGERLAVERTMLWRPRFGHHALTVLSGELDADAVPTPSRAASPAKSGAGRRVCSGGEQATTRNRSWPATPPPRQPRAD